MFPGYTPRIDGFRGDAIGAIHAAQQQYYAPMSPSPEALEAQQRAAAEAAERRAREIAAEVDRLNKVPDVVERLVRALAYDYAVVERKQTDTWYPYETKLDDASRVRCAVWETLPSELTEGSNIQRGQFGDALIQAVVSWFVAAARQAGIPPDETLGWPTARVKKRFESGYDPVAAQAQYRAGPPVGVWHVPIDNRRIRETGDELRRGLIAADGRLHIPLEDTSSDNTALPGAKGEIKPGGRFGVITVLYLAHRLSIPVSWTQQVGDFRRKVPQVPWSHGYRYWLNKKETDQAVRDEMRKYRR